MRWVPAGLSGLLARVIEREHRHKEVLLHDLRRGRGHLREMHAPTMRLRSDAEDVSEGKLGRWETPTADTMPMEVPLLSTLSKV
jgi:hypothetical protein